MRKVNLIPIEKSVTAVQWFWVLLIVGFATRLSLLSLFTTENTDGILCLTYFSPDRIPTPRFVILPGYPFLVWLFQSLGLSGIFVGRILSAVAGLLFLIPLWKLSRRWVSVEMSGLIGLAAIFSPLLWLWSLRVMPDTYFLLAFTFALERLTTAYLDENKSAWFSGCLLASLATCIRPEGLILFPWVWAMSENSGAGLWSRRIGIILAWLTPCFFLKEKIFTLFAAYQEGVGLGASSNGLTTAFLNITDHFYIYLLQPFIVFTPLLYAAALFGMVHMARQKDDLGKVFRKIILPVYGLFLVSRLVPTSYIDRHMLPFLPLVLLAAGVQFEKFLHSLKNAHWAASLLKNGLLVCGITCLLFMSFFVLSGQKDSLGDIQRSSSFLAGLPKEAVVYSDEMPKTQYEAHRFIQPLVSSFSPKAGDYVVVHSLYLLDMADFDKQIKRRYHAQAVYEANSMTLPMLTDFMENPMLQNRPAATAYRFQPQFFTSVVYEIGPIVKKSSK